MIWDLLKARWRQGHRTVKFPGPVALPERFRGRPAVDASKCTDDCRACAEVCPTGAVKPGKPVALDLGKCLFCRECAAACSRGAVSFTRDIAMAARRREDLMISSREMDLARALDGKARKLFGRSLKLRQVAAGDCSGCAVEVAVLNTVVFDLARFGIQFVASPRHADGLLVTGPVTDNMREAMKKTYEAVPAPKLVIAVGACAISGGPFAGSPKVHDGAESTLPVDLFIPGCPPHPLTTLDGLLRLLGRIESK